MSKLQKILEDNDYECRSYSGRGMYGKECLGVTIDSDKNIFSIGLMVGQELGHNDYIEDIDDVRYDNMGLGTIIYWPRIKYNSNSKVTDESIRERMEKVKDQFRNEETGEIDAFELAGAIFEEDNPDNDDEVDDRYNDIAKEVAKE